MLVVNRFRVSDADTAPWVEAARDVVAFLRTRPGVESVEVVRNLDESSLWAIVSRWRDVGSYRRALQGMEAKMLVVPLLSQAIDEPSAYADPDAVGANIPRAT